MKKFWATTNTQGKIAVGLIGSGALLFILWAVWLSDGNGISNFVSQGSWIVAVLLFVAGVGYLASQSGGKNREQ